MSNLAAMYQHQQATSPAKQPAKEKEPGKSLEWYRHHSQEGKVRPGTSRYLHYLQYLHLCPGCAGPAARGHQLHHVAVHDALLPHLHQGLRQLPQPAVTPAGAYLLSIYSVQISRPVYCIHAASAEFPRVPSCSPTECQETQLFIQHSSPPPCLPRPPPRSSHLLLFICV